jgi:hypothetical protein
LGILQKGAFQNQSKEIKLAQVKRDIFLSKDDDFVRISPDGSVNYLYSPSVKRILFGKEFVQLYKVQEGVKIRGRQNENSAKISRTSVLLDGKPFDRIELTQRIVLHQGSARGYSKTVEVANRSAEPTRLRIVTTHDPTSLQFRKASDPPGEIGVNAFNRGTHVVMDDVGGACGVRVIGASPQPDYIYMTKDRSRIGDLLRQGELPGETAGMSGAIAILFQKDLELSPFASTRITIASVYHASLLEKALSEFNSAVAAGSKNASGSAEYTTFESSDTSIDFAFQWADYTLNSVRGNDALDRLSAAFGTGTQAPSRLERVLEEAKSSQSKAGWLPHSGESGRPGVLETAIYVDSVCTYLELPYDTKKARHWYTSLRKAGDFLTKQKKDGLIQTDSLLPQGWRRRLGSGYPTGTIAEVNLAAARALWSLAAISQRLGKSEDAAKFRGNSEAIAGSVQSRLTDGETGALALNIDPRERLHVEPTIDQAVGLSYISLTKNVGSAVIHRLLDRDFETSYGPRVVPISNQNYFHATYGDGQLGGVWPRSVLAYALAAYKCGYSTIGSAQLGRLAKLVHVDNERLGCIPGEFPYWLDPDRGTVLSEGSDPVFASRLVEAIFVGELGLSWTGERPEFAIPSESKIQWLFLSTLLFSSRALFVGRGDTGPFVATTLDNVKANNLHTFSTAERLETTNNQTSAFLFSSPGQLVCVGNKSPWSVICAVNLPLREEVLRKHLTAVVENLDQESGRWARSETVRVWESMTLKTELRPFGWKMLRLIVPS